MKIYSYYGFNDFIICCGYKKNIIDEYFKKNITSFHKESWNIKIVDTGKNSLTGGRLKRIKKYIKNESFFYSLMEMVFLM